MKIILNAVIACVLFEALFCNYINLGSNEETKSLKATTTELLSSFKACIVYIFDRANERSYDSVSSTEYLRFYSNKLQCGLLAETDRQYRNSTFNERFNELKPHPLFTKYTKTLVNLYSPGTTSNILKVKNPIEKFYRVINGYNIKFNYVLIFMSNKEFMSIDSAGLFCKFATVSSPAAYLLILDEQDVNIISFADAFRMAPFLSKVTNFQEAHIQQLQNFIHKDLHGAVSRLHGERNSWKKCKFGAPVFSHPHYCTLEIISGHLNLTFAFATLEQPGEGLSIGRVVVQTMLTPNTSRFLFRHKLFKMNFINYAVSYYENNFICLAQLKTIGLTAFLKAYDIPTWIVTATACLCVSAGIAAMATKSTASFMTKFQSTVPAVLMLLIERFYGYGQVIRSASSQIVLVLNLWAFGAMLLGISYSGNIVTELTSPSLPRCPRDMQELSEAQEYPKLTNFEVLAKGGRARFFHSQIDEYLAEYANQDQPHFAVLRQFGKTLTFVDDDDELIPSKHSTSSKILLAFVGLKEHVRAYAIWSMTHSRNIRVLPGGALPFFTFRTPMLVQCNFLGPVLQRLSGYLCQCGIWKYWMDGLNALEVHNALSVLEQRKERESTTELVRKSYLAQIWRSLNPLVAAEALWSSTPLKQLSPAFKFLGIGMLLAACVFVEEATCIFSLVAHHMSKMVKKVPTVLHRIADHLVMKLQLLQCSSTKSKLIDV